jgi:tetratricopeptide (TPR) repeat protein
MVNLEGLTRLECRVPSAMQSEPGHPKQSACSMLKGMRSVPFLLVGLCLQVVTGQAPKQAPTSQAEEFVRSGRTAQEHGDLKGAIEDFRKALTLEPSLAGARIGLGAALAAAGQYDAAIEEDSRALSAAPNDMAIRMNLAMAYYRKGDLSNARFELEAIHSAHPLDLPAAVLLGYTYIKQGREAEAADLLSPLEAGNEGNTDLEYVLAYAMIQSNKQTEGLPRMEKVARAKHSADAWVIAGTARFYRGEMEEARADLDTAVELNPSIPGLYTLAGQARYAMRDMPSAARAFQAALRADPRDFVANRDLGAMRLKEGDYESAEPMLELALQLQPRDPLTRLQVAKLNEITGKHAEAAIILEDLEKSDPDWLEPHWLLASVYSDLKRPKDAKRERGIALQIENRRKEAGSSKK